MSRFRKRPKPLLRARNGGSSRFKVALFEENNLPRSVDAKNYAAAAKALTAWLGERVGHESLAGIVHRVLARMVGALSFLGMELNAAHNATYDPIIASRGSRVIVYVIQTDESLVIAQSLSRVLRVLP